MLKTLRHLISTECILTTFQLQSDFLAKYGCKVHPELGCLI